MGLFCSIYMLNLRFDCGDDCLLYLNGEDYRERDLDIFGVDLEGERLNNELIGLLILFGGDLFLASRHFFKRFS